MLDTLPTDRSAPQTRSKVLRAHSAPGTRLAHPSWRAGFGPLPADGSTAIRSAGDFWSRLGL
ncbi:hypothetical protein GR702_09755 [Novosphingobium sp. FGD1]|uniref:Uncharacterized protein n=1 Tax=Novosphingobium silvae TaxID=2692619 RepID=A0A7X4GI80_9SPHN|nr:hypothetical protein [Novosphingobium silvae]MYL98054.1 hypothetical protein [Novosphingobium silvae]